MVSEFGFRASDSGLPNSVGAGPVVMSQAQRADGMGRYIRALAALPFLVGYHVFAWVDEPVRAVPPGRGRYSHSDAHPVYLCRESRMKYTGHCQNDFSAQG